MIHLTTSKLFSYLLPKTPKLEICFLQPYHPQCSLNLVILFIYLHSVKIFSTWLTIISFNSIPTGPLAVYIFINTINSSSVASLILSLSCFGHLLPRSCHRLCFTHNSQLFAISMTGSLLFHYNFFLPAQFLQ